MTRYYTPDEADALVPELVQVVGRLRDQRVELVALRDAYRDRAGAGTDDPVAEIAEADTDDPELRRLRLRMGGIVDQMQADVAWLDDRSIVLRDIPTGLLDFAALVAGRPIWLCWRLGEESVTTWHGYADGFAGRRPLAELADEAAKA